MIYQLSWKTLPGLRGISCNEFRGVATSAPDNQRGVAVELANDDERDALVQHMEENFAARRFTNAADAFDTVKADVTQWAAARD